MVFSCNIGMLIAFIFGNYLSYMLSPCIYLGTSALFLGTFTMFPETPIFLMKIGKEKVSHHNRVLVQLYFNFILQTFL